MCLHLLTVFHLTKPSNKQIIYFALEKQNSSLPYSILSTLMLKRSFRKEKGKRLKNICRLLIRLSDNSIELREIRVKRFDIIFSLQKKFLRITLTPERGRGLL